ncbi:hypothetical protein BJ742DRAFT_745237 [Cladochytrium replicatum]|nr:hypothetical protein BJ742DRAFT_745237 [Cladochytrium replicatum]
MAHVEEHADCVREQRGDEEGSGDAICGAPFGDAAAPSDDVPDPSTGLATKFLRFGRFCKDQLSLRFSWFHPSRDDPGRCRSQYSSDVVENAALHTKSETHKSRIATVTEWLRVGIVHDDELSETEEVDEGEEYEEEPPEDHGSAEGKPSTPRSQLNCIRLRFVDIRISSGKYTIRSTIAAVLKRSVGKSSSSVRPDTKRNGLGVVACGVVLCLPKMDFRKWMRVPQRIGIVEIPTARRIATTGSIV